VFSYLNTSEHQMWRVIPLKTLFRLLIGFIEIFTTRNYNYVLHCYTFTQLTIFTIQYSILVLTSSHIHTSLRNSTVSRSRSHLTTDGQSVSKSWCRAPSGAHDQIYITLYLTITVLLLWGALSDERTGLSFVNAAGPCQRSLSRLHVYTICKHCTLIFWLYMQQFSLFITPE
jgi:hypothetical protein